MWANSGRWRRTGVLQSMGSQRVTQNLETERRWQGKNNVWGRKAYFTNEECSVLLYHPTLINHKLSSTISSVSGTLPGNGNTCSQRTVKLRIQNIFMKRQTTYITGLSVSQFSYSVISDSVTPSTAAHQASPSITNSQNLFKLMSIKSMMPSNHLILCCPLLLLPSIFPSIRVFSNESSLHITWPKYWSFSFSINPSNEYLGLISFRMDWLDLLVVQGTLKSILQHHSSKVYNKQ